MRATWAPGANELSADFLSEFQTKASKLSNERIVSKGKKTSRGKQARKHGRDEELPPGWGFGVHTQPANQPTEQPSNEPTNQPTTQPNNEPASKQTNQPRS